MAKDFDRFARFNNTPRVEFDGHATIGQWKKPSWLQTRPPAQYIGIFNVTNDLAGRPDLIANILYGTSMLDWIIIAFNNPVNTLNWPEVGANIEYPLQSIVLPELL